MRISISPNAPPGLMNGVDPANAGLDQLPSCPAAPRGDQREDDELVCRAVGDAGLGERRPSGARRRRRAGGPVRRARVRASARRGRHARPPGTSGSPSCTPSGSGSTRSGSMRSGSKGRGRISRSACCRPRTSRARSRGDHDRRDRLPREHPDRRGVHDAGPERVEGVVTATKPLDVERHGRRWTAGSLRRRARRLRSRPTRTPSACGRASRKTTARRGSERSRSSTARAGSARPARSSSTPCSTRTRQATSRSAMPTRRRSATRIEIASTRARIHIDFMIGSDDVTVTGPTRDGREVPVLRDGSWQL